MAATVKSATATAISAQSLPQTAPIVHRACISTPQRQPAPVLAQPLTTLTIRASNASHVLHHATNVTVSICV